MTPEQYAAQQTVISAAMAQFVLTFTKFFVMPALTLVEWINLLGLLYPEVERRRRESAELARTFYDSERKRFHPDLPANARELERYEFEWFVEAMEPVRKVMSQEDAPPSAPQQVVLRVVREVENAGRRQIIKAVENDPQLEEKLKKPEPKREKPKLDDSLRAELQALLAGEEPDTEEWDRPTWGGQTVKDSRGTAESQKVIGWARIATGRETCAWCLVLISRAADDIQWWYQNAQNAGVKKGESQDDLLDLYSTDKAEYLEKLGERDEYSGDRLVMDDWHVGCDCKVVPVYDSENWFGRDAANEALKLWRKAEERAEQALEDDPDKEYYSRTEGEWLPTTFNREAMNQLRQMIADGEITTEWAALAA